MKFKGKRFDFIDFGASNGGSIEFAKISLNGKNGIGIDISPDKINNMKKHGYECIQGDITNLKNIPDNSVRFVIISHVLEHLPGIADIEKTIDEAIRISTDFVFLQGPYFDADKDLATVNMRFFWSYWRGHTYHLSIDELEKIILKKSNISHYNIMVRQPVKNSKDSSILPSESPIDQFEYDSKIHPKKELINFNFPVYKEFVAYISVKNLDAWNTHILEHSRQGCIHACGVSDEKNIGQTNIWRKKYYTVKWFLLKSYRKGQYIVKCKYPIASFCKKINLKF